MTLEITNLLEELKQIEVLLLKACLHEEECCQATKAAVACVRELDNKRSKLRIDLVDMVHEEAKKQGES